MWSIINTETYQTLIITSSFTLSSSSTTPTVLQNKKTTRNSKSVMDSKVSVVLLLLIGVEISTASLKGKLVSCDKEGQVMLPPPGTDQCIKCQCRDNAVQCWKPKCAESEGCHVLSPFKSEHSCCHTCRGCSHEGRDMLNEESYVSKDGSTHYTCKASVVTVADVKCHVPCSAPVHVPGHYCPVCPADDDTVKGGCFHNKNFVPNGEKINWREEQCTECTCVDGMLSCAKQACPVLNCPQGKIFRDDSSCCPRCLESRQENYPTDGICIFRGVLLLEGKITNPDKCTKCTCKTGSTLCTREVCPVLQCPSHAVFRQKGDCCPSCRAAQSCDTEDGTRREHNSEWQIDVCTTCHCYGGKVTCQKASCDERKPCPNNLIKTKLPGNCCSVCVEPDARCIVSGSGSEMLQFTTFDKKNYKYAGVCKYSLVKDDVTNAFSVNVQHSYVTPSTVAVKLVEVVVKTPDNSLVTVTMDTTLVAMVNGTAVTNGYKMADVLVLDITSSTLTLTLLSAKVKVVVSSDGFTEVVASREWQTRVSGLCGDYNEAAADDLTTRDGTVYTDADKMADSLRVGGKCLCDKKIPEPERHSSCSMAPRRRLAAKQRCHVIKSKVFKQCRGFVNVRPYYLACVDNVCSCDKEPKTGACECPIIKALIDECKNLGFSVQPTSCGKVTKTLHKEAQQSVMDSSLTRALKTGEEKTRVGKKSKKTRKSKQSRKSKKSRKSNNSRKEKNPLRSQTRFEDPESRELKILKAELTKKHAEKPEVQKPRGPDSFLSG